VALIVVGMLWKGGSDRSDAAGLAKLESLVDDGRLDEAAELLTSAGMNLDSRALAGLAARAAGTLSIETSPAGVDVSITRVTPLESLATRAPIDAGRTPRAGRTLLAGEYIARFTGASITPVEIPILIEKGKETRLNRSILAAGPAHENMALVSAGPTPQPPGGGPIPAFRVDRHEVTNAEYARFIAAGGYRTQSYWTEPMIVDGRPAVWDLAMHRFVDRTGTPGPRLWSAGTYPEGRGNHPVAGVSWYEAAAYAKWAGKELPTAAQWWRAALGENGARLYPWGSDVRTGEQRANFGLVGTQPVGSYLSGLSPFGAFDMAGNVREWLADTHPGTTRKVVVGGSWQDPMYMFEASHAESFDRAFSNEAIGFRCVKAADR
jgi:hypothetical protein